MRRRGSTTGRGSRWVGWRVVVLVIGAVVGVIVGQVAPGIFDFGRDVPFKSAATGALVAALLASGVAYLLKPTDWKS